MASTRKINKFTIYTGSTILIPFYLHHPHTLLPSASQDHSDASAEGYTISSTGVGKPLCFLSMRPPHRACPSTSGTATSLVSKQHRLWTYRLALRWACHQPLCVQYREFLAKSVLILVFYLSTNWLALRWVCAKAPCTKLLATNSLRQTDVDTIVAGGYLELHTIQRPPTPYILRTKLS